jgi:hypothetical protein
MDAPWRCAGASFIAEAGHLAPLHLTLLHCKTYKLQITLGLLTGSPIEIYFGKEGSTTSGQH